MSFATRMVAFARTAGYCACGCRKLATDPHHIFPRQRHPELVDEPDNVIAVYRPCHTAHENAYRRFPRSICETAERLATTEPMKAYLDRTYGPRESPQAATSPDAGGREPA
jgi:hypothetical protein